ncbi:MAG: hypothetical protein H7296_09085 [Bacteroidia bacterium]|nr:hypothetical protein [Bacteroidia bacterium]
MLKYPLLLLKIIIFSSACFSQKNYRQEENIIIKKNYSSYYDQYTYRDKYGHLSYSYNLEFGGQTITSNYKLFSKHDTLVVKPLINQDAINLLAKQDSVQKLKKNEIRAFGGYEGSNQIFRTLPMISKSIKVNDTLYILVGLTSDRFTEMRKLFIVSVKSKIKVLCCYAYKISKNNNSSSNYYTIRFNINPNNKAIYFPKKINNILNDDFIKIDGEKIIFTKSLSNHPDITQNTIEIKYFISNGIEPKTYPIEDEYFISNW